MSVSTVETSARARRSTRLAFDREGRYLGLTLIAVLALLVLPPIWILLRTSLMRMNFGVAVDGWTLEHYANLISSPQLVQDFINTVLFSVGATTVSLVFGGVLAWLVVRTDAPFKALAFLTTIISLGTPYILYVTGWLYLLGRSGPINAGWRDLTGSTELLFQVNSLAGMILVEGFLWSPLVFLLLSATFRAANAEMEEAAVMSGASVAATVWRISTKLAMPAVAALALFVFIRNFEAFEVPALVGIPGGVKVLTTEIYQGVKKMPPEIGFASAYSVVMIVCVAVLLYFYGKISVRAEKYASITGKGYRPRPFRLGALRWVGGAIVLFNFAIVLVLPLSALLWMAVTPYVQPMRLSGLQHLTLENFSTVFGDEYYRELSMNTIIVAASVATVVMFLTFLVGWVVARRKTGARAADQLVTMPLVFPGLVLGIAMLQLALSVPVPVYGTLWILILGFVIRYIPYGMRYTFAGALQIHRELEQAASVSGASTSQLLTRIVGPLLAPALTSGWIFVFLISTKEMSMPLLLAGPGTQTIPVAMMDLWTSGQSGAVAALGLLWTAAMAVLAWGFYVLTRRVSAQTFG